MTHSDNVPVSPAADAPGAGSLSRRNVMNMIAKLSAATSLATVSPMAAIAAPSEFRDAETEALWREYIGAQQAIVDTEDPTEEQYEAQFARQDLAEAAILRLAPKSGRAAAMKLWIALPHMEQPRWVEEAIAHENFGLIFARAAELDYTVQLMVSAIRGLGWPALGAPIPPSAGADGDEYVEAYNAGEAKGRELALYHMARAWIDRWKAAGGDFGIMYNPDGSVHGMLRGVKYVDWESTDEENKRLPPHTWLFEDNQDGAVKVLEGMLELVPGLRETVREIVGPKLLATGRA